MRAKHGIMAAIAAFAATVASAASITVDRVAQRWPWNNKVDIYYTVHGGQDVTGSTFARIEFMANIGGTEKTIDGNAIGASASDGEHVATWTAPTGLRATDCTMTAQLIASDVPSGDDYMIINLDSNDPATAVTYEGLLATQDDSNERYTNAIYKTSKLVLRKVPRWTDRASLPNAASLPTAGYPTGHHDMATNNSKTNWVTAYAYYIGVFPVTQAQYVRLGLSNPSTNTKSWSGFDDNLPVNHRPAENMSWDDLRGSGTEPGNSIPKVDSKSGTFFQRLNFISGNVYDFDLPTEVMAEISARAGATTVYWWNSNTAIADDANTHVICQTTPGVTIDPEKNTRTPIPVGSLLPNGWGLYDVAGNVREFCRDAYTGSSVEENLALRPDAFTPAGTSADDNRICRFCGQYANTYVHNDHKASSRNGHGHSFTSGAVGFRVACIIK